MNTEYPELEAAIEAARDALNSAAEPWQHKREQLEAEEKAALAPLRSAYESATDRLQAAKTAAHVARRKAVFDQCLNSIPDAATFGWFACWCKGYHDNAFHNFSPSNAAQIQTPKVPGLTLLGLVEGTFSGATKFYGAWSDKTHKLVGLLSIEPAKHPGDSTDGYATVNGKPVKFESDPWTGKKRPFKTWIAHLRTI
jgi:hypothetical protein